MSERSVEHEMLLEKAYIDREIWHLCSIDENNNITMPSTEVLYQNGLATEVEYQMWLQSQEPKEPTFEELQIEYNVDLDYRLSLIEMGL